MKTSGCSGMAYKLEFADVLEPDDQVFDSHGIKVIVDPKSLVYIDGTQLDYTREGIQEGFKFNNPNEKTTAAAASPSASEEGRPGHGG